MNKQREALEMALEWIESQQEPRMIGAQKAIQAIREALAEPKPVSHHSEDDLDMVARKPLTDEEIADLWDGHVVPVFGKNGINPIVFARAIERAHGIGDEE